MQATKNSSTKKQQKQQKPKKKMSKQRILGEGTFGCVVQDPADPNVAIKIMPLFDDDGCVEESSLRELLFSSMLRSNADSSKSISMYIGATVSSEKAEVSVYMPRANMDLAHWVKTTMRKKRLEHVADFATQLVDSLDSLHRSGFIHGDLKPANVLLYINKESDNIDLKIADLGSCSLRRGQMCPDRCTYAYRAPEGFFEFPPSRYYDYRSFDYFAVGAILYNIIYGKLLIPGNAEQLKVQRLWQSGTISKLIKELVCPPDVPPDVHAMMMSMLTPDPRKRWTSAEDTIMAETTEIFGIKSPSQESSPSASSVASSSASDTESEISSLCSKWSKSTDVTNMANVFSSYVKSSKVAVIMAECLLLRDVSYCASDEARSESVQTDVRDALASMFAPQ